MGVGFRGEVAGFYLRYRRGYSPAVLDEVVAAFGLGTDDVAVDLGCGTGQLTLPLAERVRAVVGVDPEPDMLALARSAAAERGVTNASWLVGADTDVPALGALLGECTVGAVTIGQALHWMDHDRLFRALLPLVRNGGGVAVVTNGAPLWLQDTAWSRALRDCLQDWFGSRPTQPCGTDDASQRRYRDSLVAAGYDVAATTVEHTDELDLDDIVGGVYSAVSVDQLPPPDQRPVFAERVRAALEPHAPYTEHVTVSILAGRARR